MSDLTFELEPFENEAHKGFRGTAGPYGEVMAYHIKPVAPNRGKIVLRSQLVSEHLPEAHLDAIGAGGKPSVYQATLEIDGTPAKLRYNSYGLTRAARALHITYADRAYTYRYTTSLHANIELSRPGLRITTKDGRRVKKVGVCRDVSAQGVVDELDLALAVLFEVVSTEPLVPVVAALYASDRASANRVGSE
ncbi:hypothetical protein RVR_7002 [Actinacidiphila reveromycinica]|uniref:Uncharacterized protein n=1 Tax=Actinacidiphila reveromycinica TaxID=659352 RepID=A0A7U3VQS4_9ACTN|nr:hypothetical protein [Streptomyces sp. SN-593]BBB00101.1 hypothetical protein RVR_7002 [Streptomyces sp. SN-593]